MQLHDSNVMQRLQYFVQRHPKVSLAAAFVIVLCVVIPPSIIAATRVMLSDDLPGTHGSTTRLVNNWTITPAGTQTDLGDLPLNAVLSPDGKDLLVDNGGTGIQSLQVVNTANSQVIQTIPYYVPDSVFVGLVYSPDGKHAYASGGGYDVVHTFDVQPSGKLVKAGDVTIGALKDNPFPTGLSISPNGKTLYVANNLANDVAVIDVASKKITKTIKIGDYPYTTLVSKDGKTIYASNWGAASLSVINAVSNRVVATIPVGQHPNALAFGPGHTLFVTDGNSDAVSVVDTVSNHEANRISLAPYRRAPLSSSPVGLAVSPDQKYLYVTNAGENAIVVIAIGNAKVLGRVPTAWYPTSVVTSKDGSSLFVTNAKGRGAGPNNITKNKSLPPNPARKNPPITDGITGYKDNYCNCTFNDYSGSMIVGTLSTVIVPGKGLLDFYTNQVEKNDHVGDKSVLQRSAGNPIPVAGGISPIKHVIYIVKENRTYDQVFGDESVGNGDPSLTLFPRDNTPNIHALADHYGIFDNFYADAEVSADGHNWINSANASDYNEKMWPQDYAPGAGRNRGYDFEGGSSINLSAGGYIWDAAAEKHITYRDYGEFYQFTPAGSVAGAKLVPLGYNCPGPVAHSYTGKIIPKGQELCFQPQVINPATTPNLVGHIDTKYRTFDMLFRESDRFAEWAREFKQFEANNNLPQLTILRVPNDHTSGTTPGRITPQSAVAENDLAVGQVVDTLSHSKFWSSTAIFITEDDSQNGPDHVDAHRTESLIVSPYTYHASSFVDHTLYDTAAMVRTIELILGLRTLSQYDAAATPMWRDFNAKANTKTFTALLEKYKPSDVNSKDAYGADESAQMNFTVADVSSQDQPLNQILWHSIKGADTPYPSVVGSGAGADSDG